MFLIFTLRRPDVFPVTDLGVQKGFKIFYSLSLTDKFTSAHLMLLLLNLVLDYFRVRLTENGHSVIRTYLG